MKPLEQGNTELLFECLDLAADRNCVMHILLAASVKLSRRAATSKVASRLSAGRFRYDISEKRWIRQFLNIDFRSDYLQLSVLLAVLPGLLF